METKHKIIWEHNFGLIVMQAPFLLIQSRKLQNDSMWKKKLKVIPPYKIVVVRTCILNSLTRWPPPPLGANKKKNSFFMRGRSGDGHALFSQRMVNTRSLELFPTVVPAHSHIQKFYLSNHMAISLLSRDSFILDYGQCSGLTHILLQSLS